MYVEVLVENADVQFDAGAFVQPVPGVPSGLWQVAWNETYLTEDGTSVLSGYPHHIVPKQSRFRIVFIVHSYRPGFPLESSYGKLKLPEAEPMPERLWRLAPYETVD